MHPRTPAIAQMLRRYWAEKKRLSFENFRLYSKGVLSPKESREVFEYNCSIKPCLAVSTERMFVWTCRQDHFNDNAVDEMVQFIGLRDKLDKRQKKVIVEEPIKQEPVEVESTPEKIDLTKISTEDLAAELFSRGWMITYGTI